MKKILSISLILILVISIIPFSTVTANAAGLSLDQLKAKFPEGKYWNHYVNSTSEASDYLRLNSYNEGFANTTTSSACALHGSASLSYFVGKYDCNYFDGGVQCFGFARKLGYDAFGSRVSGWSTTTSSSGVKAGDVIRYTGGGATGEHSVFVISASGSTVKVGECNWGKNCVISWGRSVNLSNVNIVKRYIAPSTLSTSTQTVSFTSDSKYSSFKGFKGYLITGSNVIAKKADLSSRAGEIYTTDYCTINDVYTNGYCSVTFPVGSGTITGYVPISNFIISPSASFSTFTAQKYINLYTTASRATQIFRVYTGDVCYKIGISGTSTQIFMPLTETGKYVLGWIATSDLNPPSTNEELSPGLTSISASNYAKCYTITSGRYNVYTSSDLSTRGYEGTASSTTWTGESDEDHIIGVGINGNGVAYARIQFPVGSDRYTGYVPLHDTFVPGTLHESYRTAVSKVTGFSDRAGGTVNNSYWVDPGEKVYLLSQQNGYSQILYPTSSSGIWRIAWCTNSLYNSMFQAQTFSVTYNANGGTGAPANQTKTYGVDLKLSSSVPTRTGYTFVGWATSANATSAAYMAGSTYSNNAAISLYAVWRINEYHVTFDANGGTGAPATQTKTYGANLALSSVSPTFEGYIFAGWNTAVDGSGTAYESGATYSLNADLVLYAQWTEITVSSLTIATPPEKNSYNIGENFDPTGLTLNVTLSDGSNQVITDGFECEYDPFVSAGTKTVTIRYMHEEITLTVQVSDNAPAIAETLNVTDKTIHSGEEFTVDVNIENNPGFCYLKLRLVYDEDSFDFIEAVNGVVSTDSFSTASGALLWDSDSNATADGKLVTLKFKAKDEIAEGTYSLGIAFVEGYNFDEEDILLGVNNATITVADCVCGDVTGDNVINGKDLVRLRRYLLTVDETSGLADVEISLGADTTGDGVVNGKDLVRLRKYLLNYDEETGTSPIILGAG